MKLLANVSGVVKEVLQGFFFSGYTNINANITLVATDAGKLFRYINAGNFTATLPLLSTMSGGDTITIRNADTGNLTISANASNSTSMYAFDAVAGASITLAPKESVTLVVSSGLIAWTSALEYRIETAATIKSKLGISTLSGSNTGDNAVNSNYSGLVSNATHTGDVTGSTALTIANNAVTNAKLAQVATASFLGRITASLGNVETLTATQATSLLDTFTSALKGLVPASGGGTANFLRADGTWAAPASGGTAVGSKEAVVCASTVALTLNSAQTVVDGITIGAASRVLIKDQVVASENGVYTDVTTTTWVRATDMNSSSEVAGSMVTVVAGNVNGGSTWFTNFKSTDTLGTTLMHWTSFYSRKSFTNRFIEGTILWMIANPNAATVLLKGFATTNVGTATAATMSASSQYTLYPRMEYLVTTAATTAIASIMGAARLLFQVASDGFTKGGFYGRIVAGKATGNSETTGRFFMGFRNLTTTPTDVDPSTLVDCIGIGWDILDATVQIMYNSGSGTCTKVDTGWTRPSVNRNDLFKLEVEYDDTIGADGSLIVTVWSIDGGASVNGFRFTKRVFIDGADAKLPGFGVGLTPLIYASAGGVSSVEGIVFGEIYIDMQTGTQYAR